MTKILNGNDEWIEKKIIQHPLELSKVLFTNVIHLQPTILLSITLKHISSLDLLFSCSRHFTNANPIQKRSTVTRLQERIKSWRIFCAPAWTIDDITVIDCCKRFYFLFDSLRSWSERVEGRNFPSNWIPMNRRFLLFCIQHFCAQRNVHKLDQLFSDSFPREGLFRMN